jgi:iron complex outermembrane receptor protein
MFNTILLSINLLSVCADSTDLNKTAFQDSLKEDIVIKAVRADNLSPVTQYNFTKKEINEKYYGQDISYVLQSSPSIVAQSDAGNGFGYSYIRMRGMDYSRINFNINGVPVNDAETQGFFTNNFADLASSAQSIQVQRGIGTTGNGTAPYAGSIGLVTNDLRGPASFGLTTGYGSFNSSRVTAEYNTGMISNKFAFYGRLSSLKSDGYRDNSGTDLRTYFVSGAYFGKKSILKFNAFGGITRSQLAYNATDVNTIAQYGRKYNAFGANDKDEFQQNFYQLQYTYFLNSKWNIAASAYYVHGAAPVFQITYYSPYSYANMPNAVVNGDTIYGSNMSNNYRLNQDFYGGMAFLNYEWEGLKLNFGAHANSFRSEHFLEIPWAQITPDGISPNHSVYSNVGYKSEISAFAKISYTILSKLMVFGDFQIRNASFSNVARDNKIFRDTFKVDKMNWTFFNPKAGLRYFLNNNLSFYGSVGYVTREPTRTDLMLGSDYATEHITQNSIKPETVMDIEFGTDIKTDNLKIGANVYLMEFRNEIAATGQLNIFGYGYRKNVASSFRRGLELSAQWRFLPMLTLITNSTFSYNRIKEYTQSFPVYDAAGNNTYTTTDPITYKNVNPVLSPACVANLGLRFEPLSWVNVELMGRYVSKSYLDNTNNEQLTVPEYVVGDLRATLKLSQWIKIKDLGITFQCNNITNTLYSPAGTPSNVYMQDVNGNPMQHVVSPAYFPAATRNFFVTLSAKF